MFVVLYLRDKYCTCTEEYATTKLKKTLQNVLGCMIISVSLKLFPKQMSHEALTHN